MHRLIHHLLLGQAGPRQLLQEQQVGPRLLLLLPLVVKATPLTSTHCPFALQPVGGACQCECPSTEQHGVNPGWIALALFLGILAGCLSTLLVQCRRRRRELRYMDKVCVVVVEGGRQHAA
jgi:hypothetical protein